MIRRAYLPPLAVTLAVAVLSVVGCYSRPSDETAAKHGSVRKQPEPSVLDDSKLFQHWATPVGALILSGEQRGYLEPCGCTAGQRGGLARRLDLVQRLRAQGWPLALVDLGSLSNNPSQMGGPGKPVSAIAFRSAR
jgi:hypothetical protein